MMARVITVVRMIEARRMIAIFSFVRNVPFFLDQAFL